MIPVVFKSFLQQLLHATEMGTVQWREAEVTSYYCQKNGRTVVVSKHFDPDREISEIRVRFESKGKITPFSVYDYESSDYTELDNLFNAVIANANKVESELSDFFADSDE